MRRRYTQQEMEQIKAWISEGLSNSEIAKRAGRSTQSIYLYRLRCLKDITPQKNTRWTQERLAIAQTILDTQGTKAAADHFGVSKQSIFNLLNSGKLTRNVRHLSMKDQPQWSEQETDFLIDKSGIWSIARIAKKLGRTYGATKRRMVLLRKDGHIGSGKGELGDWSVRGVSRLLEVPQSAIHAAIKRKDLKAKRYNRWYSIAPATLLVFLERAKDDKKYKQFWDIPKDTMEWIRDCEKGSYWGNRD